jgi:hypothetical protein
MKELALVNGFARATGDVMRHGPWVAPGSEADKDGAPQTCATSPPGTGGDVRSAASVTYAAPDPREIRSQIRVLPPRPLAKGPLTWHVTFTVRPPASLPETGPPGDDRTLTFDRVVAMFDACAPGANASTQTPAAATAAVRLTPSRAP